MEARRRESVHTAVSSLEELSETNLDSDPGLPHWMPLKATRENQCLISPKVLLIKQT